MPNIQKLQEITVNNQKLTYVEIGEGTPTIVILGWLANLETFPYSKVFKNFEKSNLTKNKIIFLHLSNFGKSQLSKKPYTIEDYVYELNEFIKLKNFGQVNLVGHSAGGRHVIKYTLAYPNKVNKLILMSAAGFIPKTPKVSQLLKINFYFHKFNAVLPNQLKILQETFKNIYKSDLRNDIKNINTPTLILWGKKDNTIKPEKADYFKENIKNSKLIKFKNLGHMVTLNSSVWKKVFLFLEE